MIQEKRNLKMKLKEDFNEINDVLKRCEEHVPEGSMLSFDGYKVLDNCKKCGEMYKRNPTPEERREWEYLVREARFY